jgi:acetyl-CoA carboxylase biotin carboxyl carrier protein
MARDPQRMEPKMRKLESAEAHAFPRPAGKSPSSAMDVETLRAIVEIVEKTDITRLEWRRGDERLLLRRGVPAVRSTVGSTSPASPHAVVAPLVAVAPAAPLPVPSAPAAPAPAASAKVHLVTSPFVGTFYRAPSPEAQAFIEVGQTVRKGQVLCIVEAMKLMNEIESEFAGKVVEILAMNGHPVEFGQALFKIEAE